MISIIIPTYNEEDRIGISLQKLIDFLKDFETETEVIVVDDASTDGTYEAAKKFEDNIKNFKILRLSTNLGKGWAVQQGFLTAKGNLVLFTDADFSTPIEEIHKLIEKINEGADIAAGSRAIERSLVKRRQSPIREYMGRIFNILVQLLTVRGIVDTQCGFKMFKRSSTEDIFKRLKILDFGFDVELLYLAQKKGLKIAEVPVLWFNDPRSTVNPIKDSFLMFVDLIKIRLLHSDREGGLLDKTFYYLYTYRTFWRFSIVGVTNTIIDYGMFVILTRLFGLDPLKANPIAVETAIVWSFVWNNLWTFSERKVSKPLLVRFLVFQFVSLGGLALSQTSLLIFNKLFNIFDLLAKALTIPIVFVFNYLLNSRWTFRDVSAGRGIWYLYLGFVIFIFGFYLILIWALTGSISFFIER